jgi:hypothetical protein
MRQNKQLNNGSSKATTPYLHTHTKTPPERPNKPTRRIIHRQTPKLNISHDFIVPATFLS